jgi:hypothetical protein
MEKIDSFSQHCICEQEEFSAIGSLKKNLTSHGLVWSALEREL